MPKVYTTSIRLKVDILDAFAALQEDFTDQFVYARKDRPYRFFGFGRCIAVSDPATIDYPEGERPPYLFTFQRFDPTDPREADPLTASFPSLAFLVPELVLGEDESGVFLQLNSLGPVYKGRMDRFARRARSAPTRSYETPQVRLERDSREEWSAKVGAALRVIESGTASKVVLARRLAVRAVKPFSSKDLLLGLFDNRVDGTVIGYRYGDVFFAGCTPELLVRASGGNVESMCLAGSAMPGVDPRESEKDLREHQYVVDFVRAVIERTCYDVQIPAEPELLVLPTITHVHTPVAARQIEGHGAWELAAQLQPTPALAGAPVGEARMAIRRIEDFHRGFFGGLAGVMNADGDGEFSVAIRSGIFDGTHGYMYAGCGIVEGSDAEEEYAETSLKFAAMMAAMKVEGE